MLVKMLNLNVASIINTYILSMNISRLKVRKENLTVGSRLPLRVSLSDGGTVDKQQTFPQWSILWSKWFRAVNPVCASRHEMLFHRLGDVCDKIIVSDSDFWLLLTGATKEPSSLGAGRCPTALKNSNGSNSNKEKNPRSHCELPPYQKTTKTGWESA